MSDIERNAYTRWTEAGHAKRETARREGRALPALVTPTTAVLKAAPAQAPPKGKTKATTNVVQGHVTKAQPKSTPPLCVGWVKGDCAKGDACPNSHSKRFRNALAGVTVPPAPKAKAKAEGE